MNRQQTCLSVNVSCVRFSILYGANDGSSLLNTCDNRGRRQTRVTTENLNKPISRKESRNGYRDRSSRHSYETPPRTTPTQHS